MEEVLECSKRFQNGMGGGDREWDEPPEVSNDLSFEFLEMLAQRKERKKQRD